MASTLNAVLMTNTLMQHLANILIVIFLAILNSVMRVHRIETSFVMNELGLDLETAPDLLLSDILPSFFVVHLSLISLIFVAILVLI